MTSDAVDAGGTQKTRDVPGSTERVVPALRGNERFLAAQQEVRRALSELLDKYDPFDEDLFPYLVSQSLNAIGDTDAVSRLVGASPATIHRWAAGTSTPMALMRGAVVALLKRVLEDGLPVGDLAMQRALSAASDAAQAKMLRRLGEAEAAVEAEISAHARADATTNDNRSNG